MTEHLNFHYTRTEHKYGPSFVWLHGWGKDLTSLNRLAQLYQKKGNNTLFDLPGFGKTALPPRGSGTDDYADMLAKTLKALDLPGPHIFIGHSFGGRIAVQMAARHPDMTKSIILIAGAGLKRKRSITFKIRSLWLKTLGKLARTSDNMFKTTYRETYSKRYGSADYKAAGDLRPTFVKVVNENLVAEAQATTCPALLIYASDDNEAPPEIGKKYASLMVGAQYHELKGYGHLDILDRGAYQCQALIDAFIQEQVHP